MVQSSIELGIDIPEQTIKSMTALGGVRTTNDHANNSAIRLAEIIKQDQTSLGFKKYELWAVVCQHHLLKDEPSFIIAKGDYSWFIISKKVGLNQTDAIVVRYEYEYK